MSDSTATGTDLASYLAAKLALAKTNRSTLLEDKWLKNWGAVTRDDEWDSDERTWKKKESRTKKSWKSDTYFDVTRQKVVAATNLILDIVFKGNRVPFILDPDARSQFFAQEPDPNALNQAVEANEDLIHRQAADTKMIRELGRCLFAGAMYGEYVAKSYVTEIEENIYNEAAPGVWARFRRTSDSRGIEAKSLWYIWRDLETPDIAAGEYIFELELVNQADLQELKGTPYFSDAAIVRALGGATGSGTGTGTGTGTGAASSLPPGQRNLWTRERPIEKYEAWAWVPQEYARRFMAEKGSEFNGPDGLLPEPTAQSVAVGGEVAEAGAAAVAAASGAASEPVEARKVRVYAVFVGSEVIGFKLNPGPPPYYREEWEVSCDGVKAWGLADAMADSQVTLNGMVRSLENNLKLVANFIVAAKRRMFTNRLEDVIDEGGVLEMDEECPDIRTGLQQVQFHDVTAAIINGIQMFLNLADYASHIPRVEQGQQSENPQTAFELQQRLERAGKYLAAVIQRFDGLIAWAVQQCYDYNMGNPECPAEKVPCVVRALGFTSFENRYLRLGRLMTMLKMALESEDLKRETRIRRLWEEIGKAQDLDPDEFLVSLEERMAQEMTQEAGPTGPIGPSGVVEPAAAPEPAPGGGVAGAEAQTNQAAALADLKRRVAVRRALAAAGAASPAA